MKKEQLTLNEYQKLASFTRNKNINYKESLTESALGLTGEAGEVVDIIKKYIFHGHPMNESDLVKELGDIFWYIADTATTINVSLEDIAYANLLKLRKRYPQGFSESMSINRVENKNTLK